MTKRQKEEGHYFVCNEKETSHLSAVKTTSRMLTKVEVTNFICFTTFVVFLRQNKSTVSLSSAKTVSNVPLLTTFLPLLNMKDVFHAD